MTTSRTSNSDALDWLAETAAAADLPWQESWRTSLDALFTWVARFSRRTNLVGDASPRALAGEHVVEALAVAAALRDAGVTPTRIVDVGAGAGVETLTLAVWAADAQVIAVEPRRKRADFIELAADAMGVGARVTVARAQVPGWADVTLADVATSRATFPPERWAELGPTLTTPTGAVVVHGRADDAWSRRGVPGRAVPGRPEHRVHLLVGAP